MRGGVSLAVWIGGACAEIDALRRAQPPGGQETSACEVAGEPFWRDVLTLSRYSNVLVDVLAGASAGGFNCVVYAASQVWDFPLDQLKQVWAESGELKSLLRTRRPWSSILDGDEHFLAVLQGHLQRLVERASAAGRSASPKPPALDLRLSATMLTPVVRPVPSPTDEVLRESRFAGSFHFRHPASAWLPTHLPPADSPGARAAMWRLAVAARATSSFPVAFEAARVVSRRPSTFHSDEAQDAPGPDVDMAGAFGDRTSTVDGTFLIGDGGALDNIPLGRALDAIAAASADGPTRRVLLYLHPGAPPIAAPIPAVPVRTGLPTDPRSSRWVVQGLAGALLTSESIDRDIRQLEEHNAAVARASASRASTFSSLERTNLVDLADTLTPGYVRQRNDVDAALIGRLLDDPIAFLGEDPFPTHVDGTAIADELWRSPLGGMTAEDRGRARQVLWEILTERAPAAVDTLATGTRPLHRVLQLVLEWLRWREVRDEVCTEGVGALKARLYELLTVVDELLERPRRLGWVAGVCLARAEGMSVEGAIAQYEALDGLMTVKVSGVDEALADPFHRSSENRLRDVRREVLTALDAVARRMASSPSGGTTAITGTDLRLAVRDQLVETVVQLRGLFGPPSADVASPGGRHPGWYLDRVLGGPAEPGADTLGALEVICYREFAVGVPARPPIELARLSAAARTPVAKHLPKLTDTDTDTDTDTIPYANKLAGNLVHNFSAFFVKQWRDNDWFWGRMDAVPRLVDLLVNRDSVAQWLSVEPEQDLSRQLDALRTMATKTDDPVLAPALLEEWEHRKDDVRAEIEEIHANAVGQCNAVRDMLVARRQWELLKDELAPDAADTAALRARLTQYDVGIQTLHDPLLRLEHLLRPVKSATRGTVWDNLPVQPGGLGGLLIRLAIRIAVRQTVQQLTAAPKPTRRVGGREGA